MCLNLWHDQMIWYFLAGLKTKIILCFTHPIYDSWNLCFLLKYISWKLQLESWNTNHKLLNRTVKCRLNYWIIAWIVYFLNVNYFSEIDFTSDVMLNYEMEILHRYYLSQISFSFTLLFESFYLLFWLTKFIVTQFT